MAITKTQVSELYATLMGRASEGEGNNYWASNYNDQTAAADAMLGTQAVKDYFGPDFEDDTFFVETIYLNTLNKTAEEDPGGIAYWVGRLDGSTGPILTRAEMMTTFIATVNGVQATDPTPSSQQYTNRVAVSDYTADTLATLPDNGNYKTSLAFHNSGDTGLVVTDDMATKTVAEGRIDDLTIDFSLVPAETSINEGSVNTFTFTADKAVSTDTVVIFTLVPNDTAAPDRGTADTNGDDFAQVFLRPVTATIAAGDTTATFDATSLIDYVLEDSEGYHVEAVVDPDRFDVPPDIPFSGEAALIDVIAPHGIDLVISGDQDAVLSMNGIHSIDSTLDSGARLIFDGNTVDDSSITSAEGDDYIDISGHNMTVHAGEGDNRVTTLAKPSASDPSTDTGTVDIVTGFGDDTIVASGHTINIYADHQRDEHGDWLIGTGTNIVDVNPDDNDDSLAQVFSGNGNDTVTVDSGKGQFVYVDARSGENDVTLFFDENEALRYGSVDGGGGIDTVSITHVFSSRVRTFEGNDTIDIVTDTFVDPDIGRSEARLNVYSGEDNDIVTIDNRADYMLLHAELGTGDDRLVLNSLEDDYLNPDTGLVTPHTILGETGSDTLVVPAIDVIDRDYTFYNISSIETVEFAETTNGDFNASSAMSNDAGVTTYDFAEGLASGARTTLIGLNDNTTIKIDQSGQADYGNDLGLDGLNSSAATNSLTLDIATSNNDMDIGILAISDEEALTIHTDDKIESDAASTLDIGTLRSDGDLKKVTIEGDMKVEIGSIEAESLEEIDASTLSPGVYPTEFTGASMTVTDAGDDLQVELSAYDDNFILNDTETTLTLNAGAGDDTIVGSAGDDRIEGGYGKDTLTGGEGADTFVYDGTPAEAEEISNQYGDTRDTITDFESGTDTLEISGGLEGSSNYLGEVEGYGAVTALIDDNHGGAALDTYDAASTDGTLYVDSDTNGTLDNQDLEVDLTGVTDLESTDFAW